MMLSKLTLILGALLISQCFALSVHADEAPDMPPPSFTPTNVPVGKIVVPEETPVKVQLDQNLKSGADPVGEDIEYTLAEDLYTKDRQLIAPSGAKAFGKVLKSSGHGMLGKAGKLEISCDYLVDPDGSRIPLRGQMIGGGGKNETGGMVAMTALVSVLGVFITGRDVKLDKGTPITMYVDKSTVVAPYMATLAPAPAVAPAPTATGKTLYTLKDGTQIVGTQLAFDGTTIAVSTANGTKLIKASNLKSKFQVAGP